MKTATRIAIEQYLKSIAGLNLSAELVAAGVNAIVSGLEGK
ncbi:hypothetical protein [Aquamicrobium sp.]